MLTRVRFGFHIEMCIERCMEAVGYTEKMKFALVGVYEGTLQASQGLAGMAGTLMINSH